jgi:hypothetical protein
VLHFLIEFSILEEPPYFQLFFAMSQSNWLVAKNNNNNKLDL